MPHFKSEIIRPCNLIHYDGIAIRTSDLTVDLSRPEPKEKSPWIRTGDVS